MDDGTSVCTSSDEWFATDAKWQSSESSLLHVSLHRQIVIDENAEITDCCQWRNDGVAAASSDGGPTGGRGPPTVLEFLVINFSVCLVLLSNCYIIVYCIVCQVQPLMVVFQ